MGHDPFLGDPFTGWGLRSVELADQPLFQSYLCSLSEPLSDYTFSQIFTWRNSLRLLWRLIDGHLCVFANGSGDLTLLLPPIGEGNSGAALKQAFELMDDYNVAHGVPDRSRVEYTSAELLSRLDRTRLDVSPMGTDYVYDVARMIDLAGGELKSKRQEKNRFQRNYLHRVETYDPARHRPLCLDLLHRWKAHQDEARASDVGTNAIKRQKESLAVELALEHAQELGLRGMAVFVQDVPPAQREPSSSAAGHPAPQGAPPTEERLAGFTFGEALGRDQSSIVIEKTDLAVKGLAQFIFSEFCRLHWGDRPLVNVGDDWGVETLAWTKMSYRPLKLLPKYTVRQTKAVQVAVRPAIRSETAIRFATRADLPAAQELEAVCFSTYRMNRRQLQALQRNPNAVFLMAEQDGKVVGDGVALLRHSRRGSSGRIYSLAVHPDARGRGIGQKLLSSLIEELGERGARRVYLEVEQSNTCAISLYERNGFRTIGVLPDYYGQGKPGAHMMLELSTTATTLTPAA